MQIQSQNQPQFPRTLPQADKAPQPPEAPKDQMIPSPPEEKGLNWGKIARGALIGAGVGAVGAGAGHAAQAMGMHMGPVAAGATALGVAGGAHGVAAGAKDLLNTPTGAFLLLAGLLFPPALLLVAAEPAGRGIAQGLGGAAAGATLGWMGSQGPVGLALAVATGAAAGATTEWIKQSGSH
ncbi:hypothetical protein JST97_13400 [bacterium]|nr:hypothetical protein [bacterium]